MESLVLGVNTIDFPLVIMHALDETLHKNKHRQLRFLKTENWTNLIFPASESAISKTFF